MEIKGMLKSLISVVVLLTAIVGCSSIPTINGRIPTLPSVPSTVNAGLPNFICWSERDVNPHAQQLWLYEAQQRFVNPIVFSCHGGYEFVEKKVGDQTMTVLEWWIYPDAPRKPMSAQAAADTLANLYPDRDIVFTPCNRNGYELRTKRVFYAKQQVWIVPDDYQSVFPFFRHETKRDFDTVGSIWEFVSFDGHEEVPVHVVIPATQPTSAPTTSPSAPASQPSKP